MLFVSQGFFYASLVASLLLLFSLMLVACLPETVKSERKRYLSPAEAGKRVFDTYRARGHSHDRALLLLSLLAFLLYLLSSESKVSETHRAEAGGSAERERERVKCVYERERESQVKCVYERERERERESSQK